MTHYCLDVYGYYVLVLMGHIRTHTSCCFVTLLPVFPPISSSNGNRELVAIESFKNVSMLFGLPRVEFTS